MASKSVAWRCLECQAVVECHVVSSALKTHFLETGHGRFRQMEETGAVLVLYEEGDKVKCKLDMEVKDAPQVDGTKQETKKENAGPSVC